LDTTIFEQHESQVRSYCRNFPAVFHTAKGSLLYDTEGRAYIDFLSGAGSLNYGHNHPALTECMIDYLKADGVLHALDMYTEAKAAFLTAFTQKILQPRSLDYRIMFTGPTGTNAVEAAVKLARKVKGRTGMLALMGGYHGMTLGALALSTDAVSRQGAGQPLSCVTHIPAPYMIGEQQAIDYLNMLLHDDHSGLQPPAALIIETLQAEGGMDVLSDNYLQAVAGICRDNDMLLIVDDIQVGCGRTGPFLSFERAGIVPDIVTLSKSISGSGLPMALMLCKPQYDIWLPAEHNGTFRGNQLAFVTATRALDLLESENILEETKRKGHLVEEFFRTDIAPVDNRLRYKGLGLAGGIETIEIGPDGGYAKKAQGICFDKGLIVERVGRQNAVLKILPSLTISDDLLLQGMGILRDALLEARG